MGCQKLINEFAFHPDTTHIIPSDALPSRIQEIFIQTEDNLKIQCYYLPAEGSKKIIIFFHGNAGNINHRIPDLIQLNSYHVSVLAVSYRGYGKSQGKPSEAGIYLDGKAGFDFATNHLGFKANNVIIFGCSIGSAVAINTACSNDILGLILVSPLTSGKEVAKKSGLFFISPLAGNSFNNISKISDIRCPLMVIHGTKDSVIPYSMGKNICSVSEQSGQIGCKN